MYTISRRLLFNFKCTKVHYSTITKEKWDLAGAVCLERKPVITKELNELEMDYTTLLSQIEYEMSYKSEHEVRKIKDKVIAEELKQKSINLDIDKVSVQTAQEFEDASNEEFKRFTLSPRTTEDDKNKDLTSTNRMLDKSLVLIVKQKLGKNPVWLFPQGIHKDGETMRQTAERVLNEVCGENIKAKFMGNAPCGFYKYRYPKGANKAPSVGMKIFFFKAQLIGGNISKDLCSSFQWLPQNQLNVLHEDYLKSVRMFLVESEHS